MRGGSQKFGSDKDWNDYIFMLLFSFDEHI